VKRIILLLLQLLSYLDFQFAPQVTNLSGYLYKFSKDERRVKLTTVQVSASIHCSSCCCCCCCCCFSTAALPGHQPVGLPLQVQQG
jgi:streptolysin S family bacteriocin protoxin